MGSTLPMKNIFTISVFLLSVLPLHAQFKKKPRKDGPPVNFSIQELAPGVWAAIQNDQYGKAICNAGIIDMGDRTIVFDPFMTPAAAEELREQAEQLTKRPVSLVINSHFHNDHIRGNQVFEEASIIGTPFTRDEIARVEPAERAWEARHAPTLLKALTNRRSASSAIDQAELPLWTGYYEGMVESAGQLQMALPNIIFSDSLWLLGTKRAIKLVEYRGGHTQSDLVLLLPEEKIAFMGDLLVTERHPWLSDGNPDILKGILKEFYEQSPYETFVPGHGPVSKKHALQDLYHYLTAIQSFCQEADTDLRKQELLSNPVPAAYNHWYFARFYHPNIQFLLGMSNNGGQDK